jgi:predicted alpha/beta-fold hydrolase
MIRGWIQIAALSIGLATSPAFLSAQMKDSAMAEPPRVAYHTAQVDGVKLFYREAGPKDAPTVVLLHGFPSSSHMFRELIPRLSDKYHVVAPIIRASATAMRRRPTNTHIPSTILQIPLITFSTRKASPSIRFIFRTMVHR